MMKRIAALLMALLLLAALPAMAEDRALFGVDVMTGDETATTAPSQGGFGVDVMTGDETATAAPSQGGFGTDVMTGDETATAATNGSGFGTDVMTDDSASGDLQAAGASGDMAATAAPGQSAYDFSQITLVRDGADLLTDAQEQALEQKAKSISQAYGLHVAILTTASTSGRDISMYAADNYDETYGDNVDGIMLTISMSPRRVFIVTTGTCIYMFTDYGLDRILDEITPDLSDGDYYGACDRYLGDVPVFVEEAVNAQPYDTDHHYNEHEPTTEEKVAGALPVTGLGAVLVTLFGMRGMKKGMNTVARKRDATQYARGDTLQINRSADLFLYRTTHRTRIERSSSGGGGHGGGSHTFHSSHGVSHGGRGRSF